MLLCTPLNNVTKYVAHYNAFSVYCRELAPGSLSLTGDRSQDDDSKHWAYSKGWSILIHGIMTLPEAMYCDNMK